MKKIALSVVMLVIAISCDDTSSDSSSKSNNINASGSGGGGIGGTAGTGGETNGGSGGTDTCPIYKPMDTNLPTPQFLGQCTIEGSTCTTNKGPNLCRGIGIGIGFAEAKCTCDGTNWICEARALGKNAGCPMTPCESLIPQKSPQTPIKNLLYCNSKYPISCTKTLSEICPDKSKGQTIEWTCECAEDGSFTCTPDEKHDVACP